jgi:hypothetical protein
MEGGGMRHWDGAEGMVEKKREKGSGTGEDFQLVAKCN